MQRGLFLAIALVFTGVLSACSSSKPYAPVSDEEKAKVDKIKQQVLEAHPDWKAEEDALEQQKEAAERKKKDASYSYNDSKRAKDEHDQKVREEVIKIDPETEVTYQRMDFEKRYILPEGLGEYVHEYGGLSRYYHLWNWVALLAREFPFITTAVGLFLLFRPPSWGSAHLLLILMMLPLIFSEFATLRTVDMAYMNQFNGLYDGETFPQLMKWIHHAVEWRYLTYVPSLVLYLILIGRLIVKGWKPKNAG